MKYDEVKPSIILYSSAKVGNYRDIKKGASTPFLFPNKIFSPIE
jgi:hypothetical protein